MTKRSESMTCAEVRELLPAYAADRDGSLDVSRHLSDCDDCRAELDRYQELLGAMASLQAVSAETPQTVLAGALRIPEQLVGLRGIATRTTDLVSSHRNAVLGGVAAAALAGAGAIVWRQKARRVAAA